MKILKICIIFLLIFLLEKNSKSIEIKNLASINNETITNIDLLQEIKIREILENAKITKSDHALILQQMIGDKIKKIETDYNNIKISNTLLIDQKYNQIRNTKLKEKKVSPSFKKAIIIKIENNYKWNQLISLKYKSKLAINVDEVDEIMKSKKIPEDKRDQIIKIEKSKKLNIFSKTHFNKIKKKYLVRKH